VCYVFAVLRAFTMQLVERRLSRLRKDPWAEYWKPRQHLTARMIDAAAGR
jgi:hypothetical protein